jgi:hypothetical protein
VQDKWLDDGKPSINPSDAAAVAEFKKSKRSDTDVGRQYHSQAFCSSQVPIQNPVK